MARCSGVVIAWVAASWCLAWTVGVHRLYVGWEYKVVFLIICVRDYECIMFDPCRLFITSSHSKPDLIKQLFLLR